MLLVEEVEMGNSEVKRRVKYNSWASDLSNWVNDSIIYGMGKTEEEAGTSLH